MNKKNSDINKVSDITKKIENDKKTLKSLIEFRRNMFLFSGSCLIACLYSYSFFGKNFTNQPFQVSAVLFAVFTVIYIAVVIIVKRKKENICTEESDAAQISKKWQNSDNLNVMFRKKSKKKKKATKRR